MTDTLSVDVVIVGAGFGGVAALHEVRELGLSVVVLEAGSGPGGTWYWNRYPGARCDIDSLQYSFSLFPDVAQDWTWSEKYATQPEIQRYFDFVVRTRGMAPFIRYDTWVVGCRYDADEARWRLQTDKGDTVSARFCIMATGGLSAANTPDFPGVESFEGEVLHTGRWPHEAVDLVGKRVGVIGTGSSGVQFVSTVAQTVGHLTVFQRTPYYVVPARNRPLAADEIDEVRGRYGELRQQWRKTPNALALRINPQSAMEVDDDTRRAVFEAAWTAGGGDFGACFNDLTRNMDANTEVAAYLRGKIAEAVHDPKTAEALMPRVQWGTRRVCICSNYYEAFNQPNVDLVDVRETPIERFTPQGIVAGGVEHALDVLVLATGFDAVTGALMRIDVRGRDGVSLRETWKDGARTYLGMAVAGFPNLFLVSGPQSPGTLINMATGSEMHARWIADCIAWADAKGVDALEPTPAAQHDWLERTNALAARSLMSKGDSWWTGGNIPGKPRGYMGYLDWLGFDARCAEVAENGYEGFELSRVKAHAA